MGKQDQSLLFYAVPKSGPLITLVSMRSSATDEQTGAAYYTVTKRDPNTTHKMWITISLSIKGKCSTTET